MTDATTGPRFLKRKGIRPRLLTYFSLALLLPTLATAAIVYVTVRGSLLKASFREEVTIACFNDGSLEHRYACGLPGGEFETRSGSKMARVNL